MARKAGHVDAFACPNDCGWCCTHLTRDEAPGEAEFRDVLRDEGVYACGHKPNGLSVSNAEAAPLIAEAKRRKLRAEIHPRTFMLETRRRLAVVLDWHVAHDSCPFYANYKCTAYELRPLVCRAFPVMIATPLSFSPNCPKTPAPRGAVKLELRARKAVDQTHALLDEQALQATMRGKFAKGLSQREAKEKLGRYRVVALEDYLRLTPAPS